MWSDNETNRDFLNFASVTTAFAQNVTVDEAALAKMLLFERCGNEKAYSKLVKAICDNDEGKAEFLKTWEEAALRGEKADKIEGLDTEWNDEFCLDWLALSPSFYVTGRFKRDREGSKEVPFGDSKSPT